MPRHKFSTEECRKGYETTRTRYEWGVKFLTKKMFHTYSEMKSKGQETPRQKYHKSQAV